MKGRIKQTGYISQNTHSEGWDFPIWDFPIYEVSHSENSWLSFKFNVETRRLLGCKIEYLYSHVKHLAYL